MSHNCRSSLPSSTRDVNNNVIYAGSGGGGGGGRSAETTSQPNCGARTFQSPSYNANTSYQQQQVTAKVLFGTVTAISDLKLQEKAAREARRTH